MKKCILAPDSYKGTLSAVQVAQIMAKAVRAHYPDCETVELPIADGGEGTVDCFLTALGAEQVWVETTGPFGDPIRAQYAKDGSTAILEMAQAAGLPLAEGRLDPRGATTFGLGKLVRDALQRGCTSLVLGLGGSCTNDGGTGLARALGTKFYDREGREFAPRADELTEVSRVDNSETERLLAGCTVTAMCDIDNPLCGDAGASAVFGPQKGAGPEDVALLDKNLRHLAEVLLGDLKKDVLNLPGSGAAGGLGAGVVAFLNGTLRSGIETILDLTHFDRVAEGADLVFTGEGKIDRQSLRGKAVLGVAGRAQRHGVPVVAVVGDVGEGAEEAYRHGVSAIQSINRQAIPFSQARLRSAQDLESAMDAAVRLYALGEQARNRG